MANFFNMAPFGDKNISFHGAQYLGVQDIGRLAQVCRTYRDWALNLECTVVWRKASLHDKIPIVAGEGRNYREDLKVIRPLVSSVHGLLGRVLGPVPPICEEVFRKFLSNDPDSYGQGYFRDNFILLIEPSYIERHVGKETPLALQNGKLVEVDPVEVKEQTIEVAATLPNLLMLFNYPLEGKEHLPVHRIEKRLLKAVSEQCVYFPEKVGVGFWRKEIIEESRFKEFSRQEALVKEKVPGEGNVVKSVRERLLFDGACILKTGTCPDVQKPRWMVARGAETVAIWGDTRNLDVGSFAPGAGVQVCTNIFDEGGALGVVPGGSAEVLRPLELGHLAIDEGH